MNTMRERTREIKIEKHSDGILKKRCHYKVFKRNSSASMVYWFASLVTKPHTTG